ncbi:hypothetical protein ACF3MZ_14010 [Paenibacillaceae bacterium WGS1546]|uniref:hypothetical protein n=1 Tax=Cohnella sp. WGS1546 TaxID=3366810 RepID=UPI00372CFA53
MDIKLGIAWSLPLLLITIISLTIGLYVCIRNRRARTYIPIMTAGYGLIYCWLQIHYFSVGYEGIYYVLISWLFAAWGFAAIVRTAWYEIKLRKSE